MVDRKKNASLYWDYMVSFCQFGGYANFKVTTENYKDAKVANRIHQQLSRFRKRLGEAFGFEIKSSDYKFNNGVWTWKTINWRD